MAKKNATFYVCQNCSYKLTKWVGRCPECDQWNTMVEETPLAIPSRKGASGISLKGGVSRPMLISEIEQTNYSRTNTGLKEFDRVVGGGLVQGSVLLIGGGPGIGKSTLLMEVAGRLGKEDPEGTILYVSGEESAAQVGDRSKRLGVHLKNFYIFHESNWGIIKDHISKLKPKYLIIDSIQTTVSPDLASTPGTISQIREVTYEIVNCAKAANITSFIIGHITKEGNIAGPKVLEHMVDVVIYFEGDQIGHYRLLRVIKNRFGNANEVGLFEMGERGLIEVKNPSLYFLDDSLEGSYGRSLTSIIEGSRSLFVEIQALVVENKYGNGRRTTQGIDHNRLSMLIAVIEKYFGIPLAFHDIYVNVVGGIKLNSRESDLSIIASILSSLRGIPIDSKTLFLGEVGLTGEIRNVARMDMRMKEILQMNYHKVITSSQIAKEYKGGDRLQVLGLQKAFDLEGVIF